MHCRKPIPCVPFLPPSGGMPCTAGSIPRAARSTLPAPALSQGQPSGSQCIAPLTSFPSFFSPAKHAFFQAVAGPMPSPPCAVGLLLFFPGSQGIPSSPPPSTRSLPLTQTPFTAILHGHVWRSLLCPLGGWRVTARVVFKVRKISLFLLLISIEARKGGAQGAPPAGARPLAIEGGLRLSMCFLCVCHCPGVIEDLPWPVRLSRFARISRCGKGGGPCLPPAPLWPPLAFLLAALAGSATLASGAAAFGPFASEEWLLPELPPLVLRCQ